MFRNFRRWLVSILQDTEDDRVANLPIPEPDFSKRPTMKELRDNHLFHLGRGLNDMHVRMGRVEAKVGLLVRLAIAIAAAAMIPWVATIFSAF